MKKLISALIIMTMLLTAWAVPMTVSAADAAQTSTDNILITEDFEGTTNALGSNCVNETYNGQNAGRVQNTGSKIGVLDFDDVTSGGVKISFDAYMQNVSGANPNGTVIANPAEGAASASDVSLVQVFQARVRKIAGDDIYNGNDETGSWRHIELTVNLDCGTVKTQVYSMGNVLLGEGTEAVGCTSIGALTFQSWGTLDFYLDNIQVEICDLTPVPGTVLATENFEGTTNSLDANCTNETYSGQKAGHVAKGTSVLDFEDIYSGGVKISLDAYMQNVSGANPNGTIIANAALGAASTADVSLVQVFQARIRKVTGDQANIYNGNSESGSWRHLELIVNLDEGTVKTKVYSMANALLAEGVENVGCASIGSVSFKSEGSLDFYVDNIQVEVYDLNPTPGVIFTEDFEDATVGITGSYELATLAEKKAGMITGTAVVDFEDVTSGGVKLSYDIYAQYQSGANVNCLILANPAAEDTEGADCQILQVFQNKVRKFDGDADYLYATNGWVHVEQILNLDTGLVKTWVFSLDGAFLAEDINAVGCNSVGQVTLKSSGTMKAHLDNIQVEIYSLAEVSDELAYEDFEGAVEGFTGTYEVATMDGKKGVMIAKGNSAVLNFDDVYTGRVKLSYDAYASGGDTNVNGTIIVNPAADDAASTNNSVLQIFQHRIRRINAIAEDDDKNIYAGNNGWYHIEQILNLDDGTVLTQVYTMDDEFLAEETETIGCYSIGQVTFKSDGSMAYYMDNVQVERYVDRPEVVGIEIYDIYGQKVEDLAAATHAIEKIVITFDEAIVNPNPATYITLIKNNGSKVNCGGMMNKSVYTMTLKENLEPESAYTITVSKDIVDTEGNTAGENYLAALTTAALTSAVSEVKINSFTRAGGIITVDAGFINVTEDTLPMLFIVAFYDADDNLLGINTPLTKDSANAYGRLTMTFAEYAGEGTVAETKVFCWDSLEGMVPYTATEAI